MRIDKYLCESGIASRSEIKNYIRKQFVTVNGVIVKDPGYKVNEDDVVTFKDNIVRYQRYHYYMLNKPSGYVTAREDALSKTVMDIINSTIKNLSPVGRLDKDTEGLLLITDNGKLNHNMLSPKKHVDKTYYVELIHDINEEEIQKLCNGVLIDDEMTLPAKCRKIKSNVIELTIHEGRFHQVKRMLEKVDNKVTYLRRISFGPLILDEKLKLGEYRELTNEEILLLDVYN